MAIIYSYPLKNTPVNDDLILISDSADKKKTKQITLGSIKRVTSIIAGSNITISSTGVGGTGDVTINSTGGGGGGGTAPGNTGDVQFTSGHPNQDFLNDNAFNFTTNGNDKILQLANSGLTNRRGVLKISGYFTSGEQVITTPASVQFLTQYPNPNPSRVVTLSSYTTEDYDIKLPTTGPGNDQILQSDTNGQLSWVNKPTGTGTVTSITATTPLTGGTITSSGNIGIQQASSSQAGFVSATDYVTFSNNSSTTINNNGVNKFITGSNTANTLEATELLQIDGFGLKTSVNTILSGSRDNSGGFGSDVTGIIQLDNVHVPSTGTGSDNDCNIRSGVTNSGNTSPRHINFCKGGTANSNIQGFIKNVVGSSGVVFSTTSSDIRKKKNIKDWDEKVIDSFALSEPKTFNFKKEEDSLKLVKGFIAQQMVDKFPEAYIEDSEGYYSFNPSGMTVYLMKAIKELKEEIDLLKNKIQTLES